MMGNRYVLVLILLMGLFIVWVSLPFAKIANSQVYNKTAILNTTVNISNSAPLVQDVVLPSSIDLTAYDNVTVQCNVSVFDYDNNTNAVNATFYYNAVAADSPDNDNNHYTNSSCVRSSPVDISENWTCTFLVQYFANNGTWYCNATASDAQASTGTNISDISIVNDLVAVLVPGVLDYGLLAVGEISNDTLANITNAGNRPINISVTGWGQTQGDNLSMSCDSGSIPIDKERYNVTQNSTYATMFALSNVSTMVSDLSIVKRTTALDSSNITYWKLQIPSGAGGVCNGKILFTASDQGT